MATSRRPISQEILWYSFLAFASVVRGYAISVENNESPPPTSRMMISDGSLRNHDAGPQIGEFFPKHETPYPLQNLPFVTSRVMDSKIPAMTNDIFPDSRIFFFRMPVSASPYNYLNDLENLMNHIHPPAYAPYDLAPSTYPIHLPITFISNGKPSAVYKYPQDALHLSRPTAMPTPKPTEKPVINLSNGPYMFNGKPNSDVYLLQDSLNSLFSNSISSFYS